MRSTSGQDFGVLFPHLPIVLEGAAKVGVSEHWSAQSGGLCEALRRCPHCTEARPRLSGVRKVWVPDLDARRSRPR